MVNGLLGLGKIKVTILDAELEQPPVVETTEGQFSLARCIKLLSGSGTGTIQVITG